MHARVMAPVSPIDGGIHNACNFMETGVDMGQCF
jgi:hypothetical protein